MNEIRPPFKYGDRTVHLRGTSPDEHGELLVRTRSQAPLNNLDLIERLCAVSPPLAEARRRQVNGLGAMVPHVFMAQVLARVGECVMAETVKGRELLRSEVVSILAVLDSAASSADQETRAVIATSFLGDGKKHACFAALKPMLSPRLAALAHK